MNLLAKRLPRYAVHAAGLLLVAAGIAVWARLPAADTVVAVAAPTPAPAPDPAAGTIAGWLGPGEIRATVVVNGLIKGEWQGVAVLAVNGAAPRAFRIGEALAPSVRLSAIEPGAVVIDIAGRTERIAAPAMPSLASPGIVRVGTP